MKLIYNYVSPLVVDLLSREETDYLEDIFQSYGGFPDLQQLWNLMDESWIRHGCDPNVMDSRIDVFYRDPVWLLNGLFIEQDHQSLQNRRKFVDWVVEQEPLRVADFGGGFGGLARMIGAELPSCMVEIIDPHPHKAAVALANNTDNVRFVPELSESYDILIATDVFEHVPDPVGLTAETAAYLRPEGYYLIANYFAPAILCHLPQLFYLKQEKQKIDSINTSKSNSIDSATKR
jgi:ubiquinone/menaquinone biosynthesis C-methylase UbiE